MGCERIESSARSALRASWCGFLLMFFGLRSPLDAALTARPRACSEVFYLVRSCNNIARSLCAWV